MTNLNRIKVVLVEQQKTGKWLAEQMGNPLVQLVNGVVTLVNQIWLRWIKLLHY